MRTYVVNYEQGIEEHQVDGIIVYRGPILTPEQREEFIEDDGHPMEIEVEDDGE